MNADPLESSSNKDQPVQIRTLWGPFIERVGSEIAVHGRMIFSVPNNTKLILAIIVMDGQRELHRALEPISIGPARVHEFAARFPANGLSTPSLWAQVEILAI